MYSLMGFFTLLTTYNLNALTGKQRKTQNEINTT